MARRYSQKILIEAIYASSGILAAAADKLGCTRQTLYNHIHKDPKVEAAYNDATERALDFTESRLFANIKKDKEASIFFHLKTKGRSRGYVEHVQIAPTDPTGMKEYGADARDAILSKLLPGITLGNEEEEISEADGS